MRIEKMRKDFEVWAKKRLGGHQWAKGHEWEAWQEASKTSGRSAASAWQPIETAPRDGTVVLARIPNSDVQQAMMWHEAYECWVIQWDHWLLQGFDTPTHWMPLPPAPEVRP